MKKEDLERGLELVETSKLYWLKVTVDNKPEFKYTTYEYYNSCWYNISLHCGEVEMVMTRLDDGRLFFTDKEKVVPSFDRLKTGDTVYVPVTLRGVKTVDGEVKLDALCLTDGYPYLLPVSVWDNIVSIKKLPGNVRNFLRGKIGHGSTDFWMKIMDSFGIKPRKNASSFVMSFYK